MLPPPSPHTFHALPQCIPLCVPDSVCCIKGKFIAIECKAGKNTTTALQDREINRIRTAEGHAMVVNEDNIDLLEQVLKELTHADKEGNRKTDTM